MTCREAILEVMREGERYSGSRIYGLIVPYAGNVEFIEFYKSLNTLEEEGLIMMDKHDDSTPFYTYTGTNTF